VILGRGIRKSYALLLRWRGQQHVTLKSCATLLASRKIAAARRKGELYTPGIQR